MKAVILAGGKGTRLGEITKTIPKPMIEISGKPVLEYQIEMLVKYGIKEIIITLNYLPEVIESYFGDGSKWGIKIQYIKEKTPMGSAGALCLLREVLLEDFLVVYGDLMFNFNLNRFIERHRYLKEINPELIGTLVVHPNDHPFDSDLFEVDIDSEIIKILNKPHPETLIYNNIVNAGIYILSPGILKYIQDNNDIEQIRDFAKDIFPNIIAQKENKLFAYFTTEYLKDMGTVQRLEEVGRDVGNGWFYKNNLEIAKPAVFLDRDGVIIEDSEKGIFAMDQFNMIDGSAEAIKIINENHYYAVIISNQPVVAKGFCTIEDVNQINKKLETQLGKIGAKVDAIYFCPHHPDKGFAGENVKYKIECDCRKPQIGLIQRAVKDLNIDLANSFFIGDSTTDLKTAGNADIEFIGVETGKCLKDNKYFSDKDYRQDKNLLSAVQSIFNS
jgi:histidinol-phosphate phosphatase family protein